MTGPESDTSASEAPSDGTTETGRAGSEASSDASDPVAGEPVTTDPDALFDVLLAENVLAVEEREVGGGEVGGGEVDRGEASGGEVGGREAGEDAAADGVGGRVRTTEEFDDTHAVYHDSYVGLPDGEFHEAVAATFGLPDAESAAELLAGRNTSREEFVCYLAVKAHLDGGSADVAASAEPHSTADLAAMARMVHEVVPDSPVPAGIPDVTDESAADSSVTSGAGSSVTSGAGSFVAERDRAVVTVWKRFCDPCESLKADLDSVLDAVPEAVAVAGIDGEVVTDFCEVHGVDAAPGVVLVRDGDRRTVTGSDADRVAAAIREFFEE